MAESGKIDQRKVRVFVERRRRQAVRLYLEGKNQQEIAEQLGVDKSVISRDIKAMRELWRKESITDLEELRHQEEARLALVESQAWDSWHQSRVVPPRPGSPAPLESDKVLRPGNSRFLDVILRCGVDRRKLLGLDAATKLDLGPGVTVLAGFDVDLALGIRKAPEPLPSPSPRAEGNAGPESGEVDHGQTQRQ